MKKISGKRMNGRTKSIIALTIAAVLTIFFGIVGVTGMNLTPNGLYKLKSWLPTTNAENWPDSLALGLDLRGGVYVEYSCAAPEGSEADFGTLLSGTIRVIQERLTDKGYAEATVQQIGTDGIRVEIPDVTDPSAVLDLIGSTAKLEFKDPEGNTFMDGSMVKTAVYQFNEGDHQVAFTLTDEGAKIFADMTSNNIGKTLGIYLDGEELLAPTVQSAITTGSGVITQMQSAEYAQTVAAQIQSGALPMELTQQKVDTVSATLGTDALSTSVLAAVIGLVLIMALMIFRYRLNGVVASWALCDYVIILFFLLAVIPGIQLTLPGLAGIVLGIGMAVDANVIIFERFNEELRAGRGIRTALRTGFKNAMSAILDANVTTLIAAIVLMFFGTGSIQGFAKTLLLGVVVSMLSAVVITRFLMKNIINLGVKDKRMFAKLPVAEEEQK
ncbi:MAG TPA: protein translocase subunit SecD [Candidatus Egerieenecus merdigallinarum]|nr:protein translocase subunit SecD [Candidatus Egerieenecus merdigallinarum]